ncbi:protein kinase [Kovacikia minuta CCNUW1]|uniref:serine/threonine protein kinase n=1 Tax=Kovacikia minuta TaxID=2931930 RepID=UPI001CCD4D67|nr:protein kinase [Kovacikia minuta CCNUW1]
MWKLEHPTSSPFLSLLSHHEISCSSGFRNFSAPLRVQDYIPGNTLQEALDQGQKFSVGEVLNFARQILQILVYLHELSPPVLHRDIKPSNLILGADQQIHLVDFGAVQDQAAVTGMTFTVVGTSGYTPLEQFWGRAVPASDLYALGATLIHLLTGVAPSELPQKNLQIQFSDRVSLPSNIVLWIQKLVQPDIEQRFHTARQALKILDQGAISDAPADQSNPPIQTLRAISKTKIARPTKTRVVLKKTAKRLEIHQPAISISSIRSNISAIGIPLTLAWILLISLVILFAINTGLIVVLYPAWFAFYYIFKISAFSCK